MSAKATMLIGLVIGLSSNPAWAVTIETVPVGNPVFTEAMSSDVSLLL